jgi:hypothetical protein
MTGHHLYRQERIAEPELHTRDISRLTKPQVKEVILAIAERGRETPRVKHRPDLVEECRFLKHCVGNGGLPKDRYSHALLIYNRLSLADRIEIRNLVDSYASQGHN